MIISEKTYKELNTLMSEVEAQLSELNKKKEELSTEIQKRKEQVKADFVLHSNQCMEAYRQMMEAARLMVEMGMEDPSTFTTEQANDVVKDLIVPPEEVIVENEVAEHVLPDSDVQDDVNNEELIPIEVIENEETSDDIMTSEVMEDMDGYEPTTSKRGRCTPFYYILGVRKGAFHKNGITNKTRKSTRLLTPYYKLTGSELINRSLPMGNLRYRECYPNPDESRIYSADGIAPTITAMHSDLHVWIGPRHHTRTEPAPLTDVA